jgi:formylglycine-generating enzyme
VTPCRALLHRIGLVLAAAGLAHCLPGCGGDSGAAPTDAAAALTPLEGMVYVPGGVYRMGTDDSPFPYETPAHMVTVRPVFMDAHEVTNRRFREFVRATGYKTVAERWGWSGVFDPKTSEWSAVGGADWQHPLGAGDSIAGKDDYPVVQVCWDDAQAYCRWAGKRLPTEAEWEFAARGGLEGKKYAWGDERAPGGKLLANYWQGPFPAEDRAEDGYRGLAPVGQFPPNGYGLYDMAANAWEWVEDRFSPDYYARSPKTDPRGPGTGGERVIRGGSFLCAENFCTGYRAAARNKNTPDSATNHMGFRCAQDAP